MLRKQEHIVLAGRFLLGAFLLAHAGFTTVLSICTMDTPECCDTGTARHESCRPESLPVDGPILANRFACHLTSIAGGLYLFSAVVEKAHQEQIRPDGESGSPASEPAFDLPDFSVSDRIASQVNHSPPSVPKYILTSVLLI